MSTTSKHLEAAIWLESTFPDIPARQRSDFFSAVDVYYEAHPVAQRHSGPLGIIRQDDRVFTEIIHSILDEDPPSATSPSADKP